MSTTTHAPSLRERLAQVEVRSRSSRHDAMLAAEAAFAAGDVVFAEALARRVLAHDLEDEAAYELLQCVLARGDRHNEALTTANTVLAHFRGVQRCNSMEHGLWLLHDRGFAPRGLLDIGAYHGEFSMLARQFFPSLPVLMVEPQADLRELLLAVAEALGDDCHVCSVLLGDLERDACTFHQLCTPVGSTGSSVYPEASGHARRTIELPMRTLDALLAEWPGRTFDFVKLDVQGAELDVLRGAAASLPGIEVLFVELSLHVVNHGAPLLAEVVAELDALGFAMFDVMQLPRNSEGLQFQVDAIFVRKGSALWPRPGAAGGDVIPVPARA